MLVFKDVYREDPDNSALQATSEDGRAERLKDARVDADADAGVASLDPLQRRSGGEGTLGHHCHRQTPSSAGVVDVRPQFA